MSEKSLCSESVFNSIFLEYASNLHNFLFGKCNSQEQAEDLVQEAFLRLWKNCKKVSLEKAKGYVFAISNNLLINKWKQKKVVDKYFESKGSTTLNSSDEKDPSSLLIEIESKEKIEGLIAQLPEKQRLALLLRLEGLSYKEIANLNDVSVKAIEKRIHKAISSLKKHYQNTEQ